MASSDYEGYIRRPATAFDADAPVDAAIYHDHCDSLLHLFDEYAQVRVNWAERAGIYMTTQTPASTSVWYPIAHLGSFPMQLRTTGVAFQMRLRVRASSSAGHSCTFRVVLAPDGSSAAYASVATAADNVVEGSTTSTSSVTLSLNSVMAVLPDRDMAESARMDCPTYDAVSAASRVTVPICLMELTVWAKTANTSSTPRLHGVYAAEYVGL